MTPNVQRCDHGKKKKDIMIKTNYFPRIHIAIRGWYETLHPLLGLRYRQERGITSGTSGLRRDIVDVLTTLRAEIRWKGLQGSCKQSYDRVVHLFHSQLFFFLVNGIIGVFLFKEVVVFIGDKTRMELRNTCNVVCASG